MEAASPALLEPATQLIAEPSVHRRWLHPVTELPVRPPLPPGVVQAEWDNTLRRLRALCTVLEFSPEVSALQRAYVRVQHAEDLDLEAVDRILFENLLLAPWSRTLTKSGTMHYGGEWLWTWRKAVPFRAEKVGHINRLVPWQPEHQWTYRYNLIEAGV